MNHNGSFMLANVEQNGLIRVPGHCHGLSMPYEPTNEVVSRHNLSSDLHYSYSTTKDRAL
jgi:hypothetical protein